MGMAVGARPVIPPDGHGKVLAAVNWAPETLRMCGLRCCTHRNTLSSARRLPPAGFFFLCSITSGIILSDVEIFKHHTCEKLQVIKGTPVKKSQVRRGIGWQSE